jgi:tetratricopeptide (TPR) repeat protein
LQARSAAAFHRLGHEYSRAGLWALAVAQWRKAVGLAPKEAAYYKHLGIGYARLRRYARSLRALEEAARRAPQDRDLAEIMALVREQAGRETSPKR